MSELERQLRLTNRLLEARNRESLPAFSRVTAELARELVDQNRELLQVEGAIDALADVLGVRIERGDRGLADWLRQISQAVVYRQALAELD